MAYNFCAGVLRPRIRSSAVTVDGYEATNLVSDSTNKGYLVESYIKPPVSITLWFPVNIDIEQVVLAAAVGSQRSCGVELYTHSQRRTETWISDNERSVTASRSDCDKNFACIGRAEDQDAHFFSFMNKTYRSHREMSNVPIINKRSLHGHTKTSELHCRHLNNLRNVSHLMVRITRATHSSTCAIKWLEVWGQPAFSCPAHCLLTIRDLWSQKYDSRVNQTGFGSSDNQASDTTSARDTKAVIVNDSELPEEYLDALTQDMMLMPVLLPSGKNIDQSSLDRHIDQQAKWGRLPGDPFTGKVFSKHDKPIPNVALKARMDQFLLRHPNIAHKYDFRVGRAGVALSKPKLTLSSLTAPDNHSKAVDVCRSISSKRKLDDQAVEHADRKVKAPRLECQKPASTRQKSSTVVKHSFQSETHDSSNIHKRVPTLPKITESQKHTGGPSGVIRNSNICVKPGSEIQGKSNATSTNDLDCALRLTLAGLPSFLKPRSGVAAPATAVSRAVERGENSSSESKDPQSKGVESVYEEVHHVCVNCGDRTAIRRLYRLQCKHVMCRQCLLGTDNQHIKCATVTCSRCNQITSRKDVVKAHM